MIDSYKGSAYIFEKGSDGNWNETKKLSASDASVLRFGVSVAIDGNYAVVGASKNNSNTGAAYIFERSSNGIWTQK